jgi:hypothetical protein
VIAVKQAAIEEESSAFRDPGKDSERVAGAAKVEEELKTILLTSKQNLEF